MSEHVTEEILVVDSSDGKRHMVETMVHTERDLPEQWMIDANACYRDAVGNVLALAIAGLTLPLILATALMSDQKRMIALWSYVGMNWPTALASFSMALLGFAIYCGVRYFHASAEWVKRAHGRQRSARYQDKSNEILEDRLNWYFRGVILLTVIGAILAIAFGLVFAPDATTIGK